LLQLNEIGALIPNAEAECGQQWLIYDVGGSKGQRGNLLVICQIVDGLNDALHSYLGAIP
jgi:hypothetical protein